MLQVDKKYDAAFYFNEYARDFDLIYGTRNNPFQKIINRFFRQSMRIRYEMAIEQCQPMEGKSVLDIGCGPGHYSVALAKMRASQCVGIDFARNMIRIAEEHANRKGVSDRCQFIHGDFLSYPMQQTFDFAIVTGVMDYILDPLTFAKKVIGLIREKAVFSFPKNTGILAFQRKIRYKKRCPLFLYSEKEIRDIFDHYKDDINYDLRSIGRDYLVIVDRK